MLHRWVGASAGSDLAPSSLDAWRASQSEVAPLNWFHSSVPDPIGIGGIRKKVNLRVPRRGSDHTFQVGTGTEIGAPGFPKPMFSSPKCSLKLFWCKIQEKAACVCCLSRVEAFWGVLLTGSSRLSRLDRRAVQYSRPQLGSCRWEKRTKKEKNGGRKTVSLQG